MSSQRASGRKDTLGRIIHQQNAKIGEPRPVDRANVRKLNFNRLQEEIKADALQKDRRHNKNIFGTDASNRENEMSATRAKNTLS